MNPHRFFWAALVVWAAGDGAVLGGLQLGSGGRPWMVGGSLACVVAGVVALVAAVAMLVAARGGRR